MSSQKCYGIVYRANPPVMDVRQDDFWSDVPSLAIDQFPWYVGGEKQSTTVRAVWSDDALYLRYDCQDRHISARHVGINSYVWQDSCVEFFVAPNPHKPLNYYNFEINCTGNYLMGTHCDWAEGYRDHSRNVGLQTVGTVQGPTKDESPDDNGWIMIVRIPWAHFINDAVNLPPKPADVWRANFYRLGGITDPQFAAWSPIDLPKPQFHAPQFFGRIEFMR